MRIKIGKHFTFDSSHQLPPEEIYGKCQNLHGHTYKLTVEVAGQINDKGWICNFSEVKAIVNKVVIDRYDHKHLNDFFSLPTAEEIAVRIFADMVSELDKLKVDYYITKITLYETPTSYCEVAL